MDPAIQRPQDGALPLLADAGPVAVVAPSPEVDVSISEVGGAAQVHLHAGGQGVWVARMAARLGAPVVLCAGLGGESGRLLPALLEAEPFRVDAVQVAAANGAWVRDDRGGPGRDVARSPGGDFSRHDVDTLFNRALAAALSARVTVLTGTQPKGRVEPAAYGRLCAAIRANDRVCVADVSGPALEEVLHAGPDVAKLSPESLVGLAPAFGSTAQVDDTADQRLVQALRAFTGDRTALVLTVGPRPTLAVSPDGEAFRVVAPEVRPRDPRGGGDSMTAALAAGWAAGRSFADCLRIGAAAALTTVTRQGLGSGDATAVAGIAPHVVVERIG